MLVARRLPLPPDPVGIARRLVAARVRGLALLHASDASSSRWSRWSFVAADPDRESHALDPLGDDPIDATSPDGGDDAAGCAPWWSTLPRWIGVLPYEAFRHLERRGWTPVETRAPPRLRRPIWRRYPALVAVDHRAGAVFAVGNARAARELARRLERTSAPAPAALQLSVEDGEPLERHLARIAAARELIGRGDLYQVNLARPIRLRAAGAFDAANALTLHERLVAAAPTPFSCCLQDLDGAHVISTSPELLLHATVAPGERTFASLLTAPIKGTRPRGRDAVEDDALARELDEDPKERAELTMIVDVERHDLGRVAARGSVRVSRAPSVVTHRTVHHREAQIVAQVAANVSREQVLAAMLPSGSVTGAPKVRAMEVIASLEARRRGLYTGGIGFVAHDGSVTLAMAIRTAVLEGGEGEYLTGGGIVWDSDPQRELEETRWKSLQLARAALAGGGAA